ncbi:hypothetical protein B0H11DRAFT_2062149 [Mycena galericulata]|nr:hypothetical protein B0H11DRAFT_2062149 [Mycena galericulata]
MLSGLLPFSSHTPSRSWCRQNDDFRHLVFSTAGSNAEESNAGTFVLARGEFDAAVVFAVREHLLLWRFLRVCWTWAAGFVPSFSSRAGSSLIFVLVRPCFPASSLMHSLRLFIARDERLSMSSEYQRDSPAALVPQQSLRSRGTQVLFGRAPRFALELSLRGGSARRFQH